MPVLRLFAAAREAAGTATDEVPGATIDEVLTSARLRYGDQFGRVLDASRVWCNGSPAQVGDPVAPGDEVAVLPPVSGGAGRPPAPTRSRRSRSAGPRRGRSASSERSPRAASGAAAAEAPGQDPAVPTGLTSVQGPLASEIQIRGKTRPVTGARRGRTRLGRRYAVVYDTNGPKVTLGVVWFVAAVGALALGWAPLTLLYGVAAGWAALEVARRASEVGVPAEPWVASLGAGAVAASAAGGTRYLGGAILAVVVVAALVAFRTVGKQLVLAAGATVGSAVPFGLAAACVIVTRDVEIGAAVVLVVFVSAYEAGDFLIGSGASNSAEGPVLGIVTIGVTALVVAALRVPPFEGAPVFLFAVLAAVTCPLGQLACSAILPAADAHAPAARRMDSLLLLAPLWAIATGVLLHTTS